MGNSDTRRILWIDDDPETTEGPSAWLEHLGHRVVHAESAQAAHAALSAQHFDLLLIDEVLSPEERGSDIVRLLRSGAIGAENAAAPFVSLTAYRDLLAGSKLDTQSGFLGVIDKASDVAEALRKTLQQLVTLPGLVDADGKPLESEEPQTRALAVRFKNTEEEVLEALARRPELMHDLHHREFEELIAELFNRNGFEVTLTAQTRDGGADLYAVQATNLGRLRFAVECKRYSPDNPIGPALVRQLRGVLDRENATCGVLVTTSRFTAEAQKEQATAPHRLFLQDFDRIAAWLGGEPILL